MFFRDKRQNQREIIEINELECLFLDGIGFPMNNKAAH